MSKYELSDIERIAKARGIDLSQPSNKSASRKDYNPRTWGDTARDVAYGATTPLRDIVNMAPDNDVFGELSQRLGGDKLQELVGQSSPQYDVKSLLEGIKPENQSIYSPALQTAGEWAPAVAGALPMFFSKLGREFTFGAGKSFTKKQANKAYADMAERMEQSGGSAVPKELIADLVQASQKGGVLHGDPNTARILQLLGESEAGGGYNSAQNLKSILSQMSRTYPREGIHPNAPIALKDYAARVGQGIENYLDTPGIHRVSENPVTKEEYKRANKSYENIAKRQDKIKKLGKYSGVGLGVMAVEELMRKLIHSMSGR